MDTKKNMLIIDDSATTRAILNDIFSAQFNIYNAENGKDGLDIILSMRGKLDIILLDIYMPVMDGFEVLRKINADHSLKSIPIIVVSSSDTDNEVKVLEMGAVDMISKPYNREVIMRRVENAIAIRERERALIENAMLQEKLALQNEVQIMFENIDCGIITYDVSNGKFLITYANDIIAEFTGMNKISLTGLDYIGITKIIHPDDYQSLYKTAKNAHTANDNFTADFRIINKKGEIIWLRAIAKITMIEGESKSYIVTVVDISADVTSNEESIYRTEHDELTEIYKASAFYLMTERMINEKAETKYSIICFNIEKFKVINEVFGSEQADRLLISFAELIRDYAAFHGTYGRLQADRFAICIPTNIFRHEAIAHMIDDRFNNLIDGFTITVDMGVYEIHDISVPVIQMCDRASLALQTIKGNYEKNIAYYDDKMRKMLIYEQNILNNMKYALENDQFTVYYQPIYNISENSLSYAEALVRWNDPKNGLIFPSIFIPIFERNGFIAKVDYYVWESVCRFLHNRMEHNKRVVPISVNISRRSLYDEKLCEKIVALTEKYNIPHDMLKLEITESAYNDNPVQLLATINRLRDNGFHILMDDFGSGYSSLNSLKYIPVHMLKIDMKFMEDFEKSAKAGNIVTSIVRMAKWLNLGVIAEGVETDMQVNFLRSIGCTLVQGYVFSKPVKQQDFEEIIESTKSLHIVKTQTMDMNDIDEIISGNSLVTRVFNNIFSGVGFYEFSDNKLEVIRVNDGYYEILGYTPESIIKNAKNIVQYVHPDDVNELLDACRNAVKTGNTSVTTFRRYTNDNRMLYLHAIINYISGTDESPVICIFINDITEEMDNKQSLELHDSYLNALYSSLPCGILQYKFNDDNDDCVMINANDECCKILGYDSTDDLGKHFLTDLDRPDNVEARDIMLKTNMLVRDGSDMESCEVCLFTPVGSAVWLHFDVKKTLWVNNEIVFQSIIRDITSIHLAQKQLQTIVDRIPGGICSFTISDRVNIKYASDGFYALFGYSKEEFEYKYTYDIKNIIYSADLERFCTELYGYRRRGDNIKITVRIITKSNDIKWISMNAVQFDVVDGEYLYSAMITEETEEALTYKSLLDASPTGIYVADARNYSLLYINNTLCNKRKLNAGDVNSKKCYEVLAGRTEPCFHCTMSDMTYEDFSSREHLSKMDGRRYILKGKLIDWNGIPSCIQYMTDDTERINSRNMMQSIMNNTPIGLCTIQYSIDDDEFEPIMISNGMSDIIGYSRVELCKMISGGGLISKVHPDDLNIAKELKEKFLHKDINSNTSATVRMLSSDGERYLCLLVQMTVTEQNNKTVYAYVAISNTTNEHEVYNELKISNATQKIAIERAALHYWEYDFDRNAVGTNNLSSDELSFINGVFVEHKLAANGFAVREADLAAYDALLADAKNGGTNGSAVMLISFPNDYVPRWYTVHCSAVLDIYDKPIKAVFTAENNNSYKEMMNSFKLVAQQMNMEFWEYISREKTIYKRESTTVADSDGSCEINVPQNFIDSGYVHKDDIEVITEAYRKIDRGESPVQFRVRWRQPDDGYDLIDVIYTSLFDAAGVPQRSIGMARTLKKGIRGDEQ